MWVTKFYPIDGGAVEEYYYHSKEDADAHKALFDNDNDNDMYSKITVEEVF